MEVNRENEDLQLQSKSVDDVISCSSSILNTDNDGGDNDDEYVDDDNYEDGINVTLLSSPPPNVVTKTSDRQSNTSSEENKETRGKKLSGAGQKRFKKLLEKGHSREEAHRLAQIPNNADASKRPRNSDLNGSNTSGNPTPAKIARQKTSSVQHRIDAIRSETSGSTNETERKVNPSYRDVANYVKLGILPNGYPKIELTTEQLIATQKAILARVAGQRKESIKPKFGNCAFKSGYLVIVCKNQETANWLKDITPSLSPWSGAALTAVDEKDIPQPEIMIGFFPWSAEDSNEEILTLLESQNDGLTVDAWRILQRNIISQRHVELVFTVDGVSLNAIKKSEFSLDFKFGNANLRKKFQKKNLHDDGNERPEQRDVGVSQKTQAGTGDDKMIVDQIEKIPGPSGLEYTKTNQNASGHVTTTVDKTTNNTTKMTKQGLKLDYRNIAIRAQTNPNKGDRRPNVGKNHNPHTSGKEQHLQQQKN